MMLDKSGRITFKDGTAEIYTRTERGVPDELIGQYRFGCRVLGSQRYYAAQAANVNVTDLICIPAGANIDSDNIVVIEKYCYDIKQIQHIPPDGAGSPAHILLTLQKGRNMI